MCEIELQFPSIQHKLMAESYKKEFFDYEESVINGSALLDHLEYDQWLENIIMNSQEHTVRSDWVLAHTFFAVRKSDQKIVGMIDVRHSLENEFLRKYGGHIGYSVRPTERRKGYATAMLELALEYEKLFNIDRVMLGCYADNIPSVKTIERCGGILTETKPYADGKPMNIYWISLVSVPGLQE